MKKRTAGSPKKSPPFEISHGRLEFLSDGIFAIAMTVLVLELKVPPLEDPHAVRGLFSALAHHGAAFGSYLLSFFMLGLFWYRHANQYRHIQRVGAGVFVTQLVQLSVAAFFPFSAALLGQYPRNVGAPFIYVLTVLVFFAALAVQWWFARRGGALDPGLDPERVRQISTRNFRATVILGGLTVAYAALVLLGM